MYANSPMEVRRQTYKGTNVETMTCISNDYGFAVCSFAVLGEKEALVVDTQWTRSNAYRVIAELCDADKECTTLVLSHAHPDHYFHAAIFKQAFPNVKIYAVDDDIETIHRELQGKIDFWEPEPGMGSHNLPRQDIDFEILPLASEPSSFRKGALQGSVYCEDTEVQIIHHIWGDLKYNAMIWVPDLKVLYGSDMLFSNAHPFTCEITKLGRKMWIEDIRRFRDEYDWDLVIPGHAKWGELFDGRAFDFTIEYLEKTDEIMDECETAGDFFFKMVQLFPDALLLRSDEMNSKVFKTDMEWYFSDNEEDSQKEWDEYFA